jgi:hypothetical protein
LLEVVVEEPMVDTLEVVDLVDIELELSLLDLIQYQRLFKLVVEEQKD